MTEVERLKAQIEMMEGLLARDRQVVKELADCIVQNVPRNKWPGTVQVLCAMVMEELLGYGTASREPEESPKVKVERRKVIDWDAQPLGEVPDLQLARELGVSSVAVGKARRRRSIPAYGSLGGKKKKYQGYIAKIDWDEQPIGMVPDKELARCLGVDASSVYSARCRRGIPAYGTAVFPSKKKQRKKVIVAQEPCEIREEMWGGWSFDDIEKLREEAELTPCYEPEVQSSVHVHKCPLCGIEYSCSESGCGARLERFDGKLQKYETCRKCVDEASKESTGILIGVSVMQWKGE